ncbi:NAD(P)H dehydrogenase (quinone) FQR1 [Galdieria sulphuraria]|nr:NAD(P)H dehydrogenase (quinone) FQR1 [Galdieria sulphuraria]
MSSLLSCFGCCGDSDEINTPSANRNAEREAAGTKNEQQQKKVASATVEKEATLEKQKKEAAPDQSRRFKVLIIYYTTYGHIKKLADLVKEGLEKSGNCDIELFQVPETLPEEVLKLLGAPPKPEDPILTFEQHNKLAEADGIIFGFPTRFGAICAQMKAFFDSLGHLWQKGSLNGKLASFFFSTGTQGGGQETTAWTAISQLAHLGLLYVPSGYTFGSEMFSFEEPHGGSPYGPGTFAGADGSRQPSPYEMQYAEHLGKYFATVIRRFH